MHHQNNRIWREKKKKKKNRGGDFVRNENENKKNKHTIEISSEAFLNEQIYMQLKKGYFFYLNDSREFADYICTRGLIAYSWTCMQFLNSFLLVQ